MFAFSSDNKNASYLNSINFEFIDALISLIEDWWRKRYFFWANLINWFLFLILFIKYLLSETYCTDFASILLSGNVEMIFGREHKKVISCMACRSICPNWRRLNVSLWFYNTYSFLWLLTLFIQVCQSSNQKICSRDLPQIRSSEIFHKNQIKMFLMETF